MEQSINSRNNFVGPEFSHTFATLDLVAIRFSSMPDRPLMSNTGQSPSSYSKRGLNFSSDRKGSIVLIRDKAFDCPELGGSRLLRLSGKRRIL